MNEEYKLTPYQCLVLFGLSAILARLMGFENQRHFTIGEALGSTAREGFCMYNQNERISELDKTRNPEEMK